MPLWFAPAPVSERESHSAENGRLKYALDAMQGWRDTMEDAHIALMALPKHPDISMFAVMDGHGGAAVSKFCQEYLPEIVHQQLERYGQDCIADALKASFHALDDMLRDRRHARFLRQNNGTGNRDALLSKLMIRPVADEAGSTAIVALLKGDTLWVANAGDSRGVLCRSGKALELSQDHKPYLEQEYDRIIRAGGWVDQGRMRDIRVNGELSLSRALGDLKFKKGKGLAPEEQIITAEPEVRQVQLTADDSFFVLACDGIWDALSSQGAVDLIVKRLQEGSTVAQSCAALLDRCLAKRPNSLGVGCDNMTAIIVQLQPTVPQS